MYELLPNEVVFIKDDRVGRGNGSSSIELILTNLHLVVVHKGSGFFSKPKANEVFPVSQIKIHNGQAQALLGGSKSYPELEVYFVHGQQNFSFYNGGKRTIQTWISKINEAATGRPAVDAGALDNPTVELIADALSSVPGGDRVAGALRGTIGAFNSRRGTKPEAVVPIAARCVSCGAGVDGIQGQTVTCSYCLSTQQL